MKKFLVEFDDGSWKKVSKLVRECMSDVAGVDLSDVQVVEDICGSVDRGDYGDVDVDGVKVTEVKR